MSGDRPTVIVTGVDGFVGRHVVTAARERGYRVVGISRAPLADDPLAADLDESVAADLTEEWPAGVHGDVVIHLAGLAAVGPSFDHPQEYIEGNSRMVTHLAEAMLASGSAPRRIVCVSTGAVYGTGETRQDESAPTEPASPYVVSKLLVEAQAGYYRRRGLDVVVARPFNHIGPGQRTGFLLPDLVAGLRALAPGHALPVGDLTTARDYTDVRDVAAAYLALAERPALDHDVYNVASGQSFTGMQMLAFAASALGRDVPELVADPTRTRRTDASRITGDASRLEADTGWRPAIPVEQSVRDYVAALG